MIPDDTARSHPRRKMGVMRILDADNSGWPPRTKVDMTQEDDDNDGTALATTTAASTKCKTQ